jgi:hypothetical protein
MLIAQTLENAGGSVSLLACAPCGHPPGSGR